MTGPSATLQRIFDQIRGPDVPKPQQEQVATAMEKDEKEQRGYKRQEMLRNMTGKQRMFALELEDRLHQAQGEALPAAGEQRTSNQEERVSVSEGVAKIFWNTRHGVRVHFFRKVNFGLG